ncbi:GNAT family N-acetyltransferase [Raineyella fluvialis]|uniref:GNAT family N-acetyltransferase n=1 Tax=Raineyella fluvialis TaxID=2662261 RepID=A0A5Q2FAC0_9ACTN|nr:GNAT family N-acetyltransferase [Raineyella fluvialis]QGF23749.1 GNAT family N-acetyltransferase [Raineyella fluvialis]
MTEVTVTRNDAEGRYEAHVGGELAAYSEFQLATNLIVFSHSETLPAFEGKGVASALARAALDEVRAEGDREVLAICPFINGWMHRHPDYLDLLYKGHPRQDQEQVEQD